MNHQSLIAQFNANFDLVEYVKRNSEWKPVSRGVFIRCPFHNDNTPSMMVTERGAYCFACHKYRSPYDFVQATSRMSRVDILSMGDNLPIIEHKKEYPERRPNQRLVNLAHDVLMNSPDKLDYLVKQRGISKRIIEEFSVGYFRPPFRKCLLPRYWFPTWNANGELTSCSYRQDPHLEYPDEYPENKRYLILSGSKAMLYGAHSIQHYTEMVYVGGQIDALSLLQYNIPTIGAAGEGVFKKEWVSLIGDRKVYVLLDNDDAGRLGSVKVHGMLSNSVVVEWPTGLPKKYDINSAIMDKEFGINEIKRLLRGVGCGI